MNEQLIIRLGETASSPVHWLVRSLADNSLISSGVLADVAALASLGERAGGRKLVVLVPGTQVVLHTVELPPGNPRLALKTLPYQLEELLAEDVDRFHLLPLERKGSLQRLVAVRHSQLQQWLLWLSDAGLQAEVLLPDLLLLPQGAALAVDDLWLLRPQQGEAMAVDSCLLAELLPALLDAEQPQQWRCWQPWPLPELAGLEMLAEPEELPLWLLVSQLPAARAPNLLTGPYAPKREWRGPLLHYSAVAVALLLVYLLGLLGNGLEWWRQQQQLEQLKALKVQVYRLTFPEAPEPRPEQVRSLMQARTAAVAADGGSDFLTLMGDVAPAFAAVKTLKPETLRFDRRQGEIRVQAEAASFADFEQFSAQLANKLQVEVGSQNNQGGKVVGAITIRGQQ